VPEPAQKVIDLARLALDHGQGRRLDLQIEPSPIHLGSEEYTVAGGRVPARLEVSRTMGGWALHLSFTATLEGTCVRCLGPASIEVPVDAREVEEPSSEDEDLRSPYVDGVDLDVARWADDSLVLEMPQQPICREDCKGLCAVCGESLNDADPAEHEHEKPRDPRWAKLDELKLDK
jgi:uncharacterized protein